MKENDFDKNGLCVLVFLVFGILIGAVMHGTISSQKYKTDVRGKAPVESVYDSRFTSFEWRGHKYLKYGNSSYPSVLHDPDCPCWTNRLEKQNAENQ